MKRENIILRELKYYAVLVTALRIITECDEMERKVKKMRFPYGAKEGGSAFSIPQPMFYKKRATKARIALLIHRRI